MSKVVKHRVKIGSTRYDVHLNVNSVSGLSTLLANKQDKLTEAQQNAIDSGITEAKVSKYEGYAASKSDTTHNHDTVYSKLGHTHDYAPLSHSHSISQVTGLQSALDGKASTSHNHDTIYAGISHNHNTVYEPIISSKGTAFNKSFGTAQGTVAEGNHTHNYQSPLDILPLTEGQTGTATTARTITAKNLTDIILYHSPAGSRPASDVYAWAKASTKPSYGWSEIGSKPTFATVSTSGSYDDLSDKPTIPSIPSVMTTTEGNAGTATTQRTINAANLKTIILNHSPAGSRPASDVSSWAKASTKPEYNWTEIADKPSTFTPTAHPHTISNITNLQSTLEDKLSLSTGGVVSGTTRISQFSKYAGHQTRFLGSGHRLKPYVDWTANEKDGGHRFWFLRFPTGVNFWGKLTISFLGSYSSFNASGYITKEIYIAFNQGSLYNNMGRYLNLSGNVENDFRISEAIWNEDLSCWEIQIYSHQPQGNNTPINIVLEAETTSMGSIDAFNGITLTNAATILKDTSYTAKKAKVMSKNPVVLGTKVVNWADTPVFETPYGEEVEIMSHNHDSLYAPLTTSHTHSNKALLDTYTQTEANLSDAVSKKHTHSNKALLDTYTQTEANLSDAVSRRHSHTSAQNDAMNSGITSNKVSTYDGYATSKQDKNIPYSAFASSSSGNYVPFLLYDSATGQYHLKRTSLVFNPTDSNYRQKYLSQFGTFENMPATYTPTAHQHGFITNDGTITQQITDVNSAKIAIVNASNKLLKGTNLVFNSTDSNYRQKYLSQYGTFENIPTGGSGGTGGGDVYLANNQEFTGINTFSNDVLLNHTASGKKFQINIGQQGSAKIVVNPGGNPEQQTTTFLLHPTYAGGNNTLLHSGNVKTINGQSLFGSGNISISGGSTSGNWELLRSRGASSSLTSVNSGTTSGSVSLTKSISQGDVLAIELNSTSSASYNPIVLTITIQRISTNPNSYNYEYNLESFTSWTGTELRVNNFSISASGTSLYFGNKKYIKGSFSGSTIEWTTNQSYTLYVGRVWRLVQ